MKIVFAGTPFFASRHLEVIMKSDFHISCVLTQPDRVSGRGKQIEPSPVKQLAINEGLDIFQPASLKNKDVLEKIQNLEPDLILVVAYGLLIPKEILAIPRIGCINVHGSLLPRWRGASPMEYSILHGDKKTGLSYMKMTEGLDEGPVYEMHECNIMPSDKLADIEKKFIGISENNLINFLKKLQNDEINCIEQDHERATFAPKITKQELQINWENILSGDLVKKVNALSDKYGIHTFLGNKRIKIYDVSEENSTMPSDPGKIEALNDELTVCCQGGTRVRINKIQMEGKNQVTSKEFLSAYKELVETSKYFTYRSE